MSRFAGSDPTPSHHLPRDPEFLIELPERVQILTVRAPCAAVDFSRARSTYP